MTTPHGRTRRIATLAALLAATLAACGRPRTEADIILENAPVVIFSNESQLQADVYAVPQGGLQARLGTVQPGRTDTLRIGRSISGAASVVIVARLLASNARPATGQLSLTPGTRLVVTLPPSANVLNVLPAP